MDYKKIIGPFKQLLTMSNLPMKGALKDEQLEIIEQAGIVICNGVITQIGYFKNIVNQNPNITLEKIEPDMVALPGFIDSHTHICYAGNRALDFAARNNGKTYLEIARGGGGIWSTVKHTRRATQEELVSLITQRLDRLLTQGVTTVEIKSGYGLGVQEELHLLRAIKKVKEQHPSNVVATCLAAHIVPKEMKDEKVYLNLILNDLVPLVKQENLCARFDIFIEENAFSVKGATFYLKALKQQGFELTVHGDQFTTGGSKIAVEYQAISVDHLEASTQKEIELLAKSNTTPVALPGASIGLGCAYTPARKLLDAGCSLAIASDWNPGSAPQGNLLIQASILSTFEKLSAAEVFAGITYRAANVLKVKAGQLQKGFDADIVAFTCNDYREILYQQGELRASKIWITGKQI